MHVGPKDIVLIIINSKNAITFIFNSLFAFICVYVVEKQGTACVWKLEGNLQ